MRNHQNTKPGKFAKLKTSVEKVKQTLTSLKSSKNPTKALKAKGSSKSTSAKNTKSTTQKVDVKNAKTKAEMMTKGKTSSKGDHGGSASNSMNTNQSHLQESSSGSAVKASAKAPRISARTLSYNASLLICREEACDMPVATLRYCRLHYIKNWRFIKKKEVILKEKRLDIYIEELVSKYPDKYVEAIRIDLASEKEFGKVVAELEIEDTSAASEDFESEADTGGVEEIIDTAKRSEFDDEDDFGFG